MNNQIMADLARHLAKQQDEKIREAINNHVGHKNWTIEEIAPRLKRETYPDGTITRITMDGEPIFAFGKVVLEPKKEGDATMMHASVGYKVLNSRSETQYR